MQFQHAKILMMSAIAFGLSFSMDRAYAAPCGLAMTPPGGPLEIEYDPFSAATQRSNAMSIGFSVATPNTGPQRVRSVDYQFLDTNSSPQPAIGMNGALIEVTRGADSILRVGTAGDFSTPGHFNTVHFGVGNTNVSANNVRLIADGRQDIGAGLTSENFDLAYRCNFADGSTESGTLTAKLNTQINTKYLVRATMVGGGTTRTLDIDPITRRASGGMAIRSTGAFDISIASENALRLRPEGASPTSILPADQTVPYDVSVDGDAMTPSSPPKQCGRSGLTGSVLPVTTRLAPSVDVTKLRAGSYSDTLTVTISPNVSGGIASCTIN
jgi:hypothetical protein